jgi:hypothetical protein
LRGSDACHGGRVVRDVVTPRAIDGRPMLRGSPMLDRRQGDDDEGRRSRSYIVPMRETLAPARLSDGELVSEVKRLAQREKEATAALVASLAEFDARRLYLGEGCSSLFVYCVQVLHLSEHAAYHRIEAARAGRRFPAVLEALRAGELTLTTVGLLAPHLTEENHERVLGAARHRSKREVEEQVAALAPKPDVRASVRKVPERRRVTGVSTSHGAAGVLLPEATPATADDRRPPRATVQAIAPARYHVHMTVSAETHAKLRQAQDLLRHAIPDGDPALVVDRALSVLLEHLQRARQAKRKSKAASAARTGGRARPSAPPRTPATPRARSRRIPAAVKRAVWERDGGQCAFVGPEGRCAERGFLEYHHREPFAVGGRTTVENLQLLCRAHNGFEAREYFGEGAGAGGISEVDGPTRSGPS